jgi:8-oxo-dGTP diphosphatase
VREAHEEAGLTADLLTVRTTVVTAEISGTSGNHWSYTTVIADAHALLETVPNRESAELRWVPEEEVDELPLHPGFAASWAALRAVAASIPLLVNRPS